MRRHRERQPADDQQRSADERQAETGRGRHIAARQITGEQSGRDHKPNAAAMPIRTSMTRVRQCHDVSTAVA